MEYKMDTGLVIFDLDGTLLNTIGDLAVACNAVLAMRGLPQHTYDEYCHFVGNGIMRLVERALPEELRTPYTVAAVRADFIIPSISTFIRNPTKEFRNWLRRSRGEVSVSPWHPTSSRLERKN